MKKNDCIKNKKTTKCKSWTTKLIQNVLSKILVSRDSSRKHLGVNKKIFRTIMYYLQCY